MGDMSPLGLLKALKNKIFTWYYFDSPISKLEAYNFTLSNKVVFNLILLKLHFTTIHNRVARAHCHTGGWRGRGPPAPVFDWCGHQVRWGWHRAHVLHEGRGRTSGRARTRLVEKVGRARNPWGRGLTHGRRRGLVVSYVVVVVMHKWVLLLIRGRDVGRSWHCGGGEGGACGGRGGAFGRCGPVIKAHAVECTPIAWWLPCN